MVLLYLKRDIKSMRFTKNISQMRCIQEVVQMFTDIFVQFIQDKEITPYRIAKETGISQGLMNEYKNGKKLPTLQNLVKIADYLDCSVDYLLGRTDNPDAHKK